MTTAAPLVWGTPRARLVLTATVLGSSLSFVDATVVNIALPRIGRALDAGTAGLTWVVNGYTLTLAALVLLGGALGDRLGRRRVFVAGTVLFAVASAVCGLAPDIGTLVAARAAQGVGGALLTPGSLAILQASFAHDDRGRAIGAWSGLGGVAGAVGPFLGGWIVEAASWRWVFLVNLPVAAMVLALAVRYVPESRDPDATGRLDVPGAVLLAASLAAATYALTAAGASSWTWPVALTLLAGLVLGAVFVAHERRTARPLVPPSIFGSRLFGVANLVTLVVYAALGVVFFAVGVTLQVGAGYSPLAAGLSLLPVTAVMLLFSSRAGALVERTGPRLPLTIGPLVAAVGVAMLHRIDSSTSYVLDVLGPALVFGAGLTTLVAPLTATVLAAVPDHQAGLASGVNNAVARTAGLLGVAAVPLVAGLSGDRLIDPDAVLAGFEVLAWGCAGLLVLGSLVAAVGTRDPRARRPCRSEPAAHHCAVTGPPAPVQRPPEQPRAA
ncbi:MFS transporter [Nocardioides caldifontis]|uniref:MFS transporter n=1 Tax=Nocardioides caldifontis TaxID=2588938 RepID=UPI0011DFEC39|nr:MFS transporter [Nocardioides caldifontis]